MKKSVWLALLIAAIPFAQAKAAQNPDYEDIVVDQPVHPGSVGASETLPQHVYFSSAYASGPNAPVLLLIGGEGPLETLEVTQVLADRALALGAYIVGVEHRFYGQSVPNRPLGYSIEDLKGLTVENALGDLAIVERKLKAEKNLTGPWFSFGGSYSGALSVYYRTEYPELDQGAIALSPPLQPSPEGLTGYELVAIDAFGDALTTKVRAAITYLIEQAGTPEGRSWLQGVLKLPDTDFDEQDIAAMMVTEVPEFAQYGQTMNVAESLSDGQSPEQAGEALAALIVTTNGDCGGGEAAYCIRKDPHFNEPWAFSLWTYQAFTQFGWVYVSNPDRTKSLVPDYPVTIDYYVKQYDAVFKGAGSLLSDPFSKEIFPKVKSEASKIFIVNGTFDPWMSASLTDLQDPSRGLFSMIVSGGAHCPDYEGDDSSVESSVLEYLRSWIAGLP